MQKQSNKKHFKGFTLVELIIVITILAILGTIAYISFQGYTKDARDSSRMSDIKQLYNGISIYKTQTEKTPMPDSYVSILSGITTISYQGYAGTSVLRLLKITGGKDPGTKDYYIYSTDVNQKKGQLMTFMETSDKDVQLLGRLKDLKEELIKTKLIDQAQATNTGYYQDKKIYVYGDKIGILTNSNKVPLQETTTSTGINIITITTPLTTYFGGSVYSGGLSTSTGLTLVNQINGALNNLTSNRYTISGTITNGSGGIINLCGINTSIDASGNFMLSNIVYGTNCSSIIVTRSGYNCSITTDGPISLIDNINNVAGSCLIPCSPGSQVYSSTGSYNFVVPSGCTRLVAKLWGAGGNGAGTYYGSTGGAGGGGGFISATGTVTPGQSLTIKVGRFGENRADGDDYYSYSVGGSAGGFSAILNGGNPLVVAGGGGGGGGNWRGSSGNGGAGGYPSGSDGTNGNAGTGGKGGTQLAGGAPGVGNRSPNSGTGVYLGCGVSSMDLGASGAYNRHNGEGAGGCGYYGGGTSGPIQQASTGGAGGGGGGSSYVNSSFSTDFTYLNGSGKTPGGTGISGYISGYGVGGDGGSSYNGTRGGTGLVIITWQ